MALQAQTLAGVESDNYAQASVVLEFANAYTSTAAPYITGSSIPLFTADVPYQVAAVLERHGFLGSCFAMIQKVPVGSAIGSNINLMQSTLDLTATVGSTRAGTLVAVASGLQLAAGDQLFAVFTPLGNMIAGQLNITVTLTRL